MPVTGLYYRNKRGNYVKPMPYMRVGIKRGNRGRMTASRVSRKAGLLSAMRGFNRRVGSYGRYNPPAGCGAEHKFFDKVTTFAPTSAGGTITDSINKLPQGVTESTRVGRKAVIKSIQWNYDIELPAVDAAATPKDGDTVRIILYQDKQCNGAAAAVSDLLEDSDFHSFSNLVNSGRFKILMDKRHSLNYGGMASDGAGLVSQARVFKNYTRTWKVNTPIEFNSTAGAITEIRSNNYGLLVISDGGTAHVHGSLRLRFTD